MPSMAPGCDASHPPYSAPESATYAAPDAAKSSSAMAFWGAKQGAPASRPHFTCTGGSNVVAPVPVATSSTGASSAVGEGGHEQLSPSAPLGGAKAVELRSCPSHAPHEVDESGDAIRFISPPSPASSSSSLAEEGGQLSLRHARRCSPMPLTVTKLRSTTTSKLFLWAQSSRDRKRRHPPACRRHRSDIATLWWILCRETRGGAMPTADEMKSAPSDA
mmetsp:Transcript_37592/g.108073  ORF Transcript_37592/g.108073 Transcript_37592/m.108073 type:complete len:219 (-) Transcript_37592:2-658(-)